MVNKSKKMPVRSNKSEKTVLSITEAAEMHDVTRQAIYVAIKLKKLKATKEDAHWTIHLHDLEEYRKHRYSRSKSIFNGELVFDNSKGFYSVNQVAKMLDVPAQKVYYATRAGKMKAHRKGSAWVIHVDDVKKYSEETLGVVNKKLRAM